jgi:hypothetical protein
MEQDDSRERTIAICEAFPEVEIGSRTGQHLNFSVRGKKFAYHLVDHHGDGRVALTCKAGPGVMDSLVAAEPERYFRPPYMARHGWVGYYLDTGEIDWQRIQELLAEAYVLTAPRRLSDALIAGRPL